MNAYDYDLVVLGSGPAGTEAAATAAAMRKRVAIVERKWSSAVPPLQAGTIFSRLLGEAVLSLKTYAMFHGGEPAPASIKMPDLANRVQAIVQKYGAVLKSRLEQAGVETIRGQARFVDPHAIEVQGEKGPACVTGDKILIAVGTRPAAPSCLAIDGQRIYNSDQLLTMPRIPRELTIVGAGLIGVEYASLLALLGVKITLVSERPELLEFADRGLVEAFTARLEAQGVTFRLGVNVAECRSADRVTILFSNGESLETEAVLYVAGRQANTESLNLAALGIRTADDGKLNVNPEFQTTVPNIYAAGDVIGHPVEGLYYGSISREQGRLAVCNMYGFPARSNPEVFPYGIYSIPELAMIGLTEQTLQANRTDYETGMARYEELAQAQISGEPGFLKLLFDPHSLKLLGVHIMGARAAEVIHIGQAVLRFGGTIRCLQETVFNHPTIAEAYRLAAADGLRKVGWLP